VWLLGVISDRSIGNASGIRARWRPLSEQVLSPPSFMLGGRKCDGRPETTTAPPAAAPQPEQPEPEAMAAESGAATCGRRRRRQVPHLRTFIMGDDLRPSIDLQKKQ
jgi:hypothetical protein